VEAFRNHGYEVVYYEPWDLEDLLLGFAQATPPGEGIKADVIVFAGHGYAGGVDRYLTLDLIEALETTGVRQFLAQNGVIILESCSTGAGGARGDNIANALKGIFPQAEHIFAPTAPGGLSDIVFDGQEVSFVEYSVSTYDAIQRTVSDEGP
jgi:hypothetical protein